MTKRRRKQNRVDWLALAGAISLFCLGVAALVAMNGFEPSEMTN